MSQVCIGFDTSNYTTSAAWFDGQTGENQGKLLTVPEGALGLRQSEALFQHVKRLAPDDAGAVRPVSPRGDSRRGRLHPAQRGGRLLHAPAFWWGKGRPKPWPPYWVFRFIPVPTSRGILQRRPGPLGGRTCWTSPIWPGTCREELRSCSMYSRRATR